MESKARILEPSGIEPVDRLLGGLESGLLYLVRGDASSKSLFGIKFVLEGLRQGQNCALIIRYSPEDAVRRFSRLGYDCLEDVKEGRLIILEFGDDIVQQVVRLREISPVLRELGSLLGETHPQRVVFDPITDLVVSEHGNVEPRIKEFSEWASTLGATSLLITNGNNADLVRSFLPVVRDSFRFDLKEEANRAHTYLTLEKRPNLSPQLVDVDPARGIFLERGRTTDPLASGSGQNNGAGWADIAAELLDSDRVPESTPGSIATPGSVAVASAAVAKVRPDHQPGAAQSEELNDWLDELVAWAIAPDEATREVARHQAAVTATQVQNERAGGTRSEATLQSSQHPGPPGAKPDKAAEPAGSRRATAEQVSNTTVPPRTSSPPAASNFESAAAEKNPGQGGTPGSKLPAAGQRQSQPIASPASRTAQPAGAARTQPEVSGTRPRTFDPATAARTAEELLRPPDVAVAASHDRDSYSEPRVAEPLHTRARDFRVLVIEADPTSRDLLSRGIGEYSVETAEDAVTGLAKLGALKPDLVILDLDLPVVDGFKLLTHIRSTANMPIIVLSGLYVRSSDRIQSAELGADYYMTKPFSVKELRQKARQLIARYRGISDWIIHQRNQRVPPPIVETSGEAALVAPVQTGPASTPSRVSADERGQANQGSRMRFSRGTRSVVDQFLSYDDFVLRVELNVQLGMEIGTTFSIVGCRMPDGANGTVNAVRLYGLISAIIRNDDLISMNQRNDFVVLLTDADAAGAKAFIGRLFDRVVGDMETEPLVWLRSFPHLEEATEVAWQTPTTAPARPASPQQETPPPPKAQPAAARAAAESSVRVEPARPQPAKSSERLDPRESYINLLKNI
ncbi:MAG TPA: response regulator [Blastocatellia bacterium]|nr:response regulator [Blastocatellia bacterium]